MARVVMTDSERSRLQETLDDARETEEQMAAAVAADIGDPIILAQLRKSIARLETLLALF